MGFMKKSGSWLALLVAGILLAPVFAAGEKENRGYLGVTIGSLDRKDKQEAGVLHGVRVGSVEKESPAEKAGIHKGDIIESYGGHKIRKPEDLVRRVRETRADSTVTITLVRDRVTVQVNVKIASISGSGREKRMLVWTDEHRLRLGVQIFDLEDDLAGYFNVPAQGGVLILEVEEKGAAQKAGLKPGDVIVRIGKDKVYETGDVPDILEGYKSGDKVDVAVVRKGKETVFPVTLEEGSGEGFFYRSSPRDPMEIRIFKPDAEGLLPIKEGEERIKENLRRSFEEAGEKLKVRMQELEVRNRSLEERIRHGMEDLGRKFKEAGYGFIGQASA
jgi:membrane-associated protease RseP (regulator of RpoE activity)